jgi:SAM-dependent methyltransferase
LPRSLGSPELEAVTFLELRQPGYALLKGEGIEIGGFEHPARPPHATRLIRCDRLSKAEAARYFPEVDPAVLPEVDRILDLDTDGLSAFADGSLDFVVCCHVLEHVRNPIKAVSEIFRVLRPGGLAALGIPDKRFTFDRDRALTPWDEILRIHREGIVLPEPLDYLEIVKTIHPRMLSVPEPERLQYLELLRKRREHLSVWDSAAFAEFLDRTMALLGLPKRVRYLSDGDRSRFEFFLVLEKPGS